MNVHDCCCTPIKMYPLKPVAADRATYAYVLGIVHASLYPCGYICAHPPYLQARLDEESAALAKRQQNYQRDRDQMTAEEEEEYEHAVEESMFRCVCWGRGGGSGGRWVLGGGFASPGLPDGGQSCCGVRVQFGSCSQLDCRVCTEQETPRDPGTAKQNGGVSLHPVPPPPPHQAPPVADMAQYDYITPITFSTLPASTRQGPQMADHIAEKLLTSGTLPALSPAGSTSLRSGSRGTRSRHCRSTTSSTTGCATTTACQLCSQSRWPGWVPVQLAADGHTAACWAGVRSMCRA
jgi:hypothetical protein